MNAAEVVNSDSELLQPTSPPPRLRGPSFYVVPCSGLPRTCGNMGIFMEAMDKLLPETTNAQINHQLGLMAMQMLDTLPMVRWFM